MIDKESWIWHRYYTTPPEAKSVLDCLNHGRNHRFYHWNPQYDPRWTKEQIEAYWQGYHDQPG